jgi:hypothetical protein
MARIGLEEDMAALEGPSVRDVAQLAHDRRWIVPQAPVAHPVHVEDIADDAQDLLQDVLRILRR